MVSVIQIQVFGIILIGCILHAGTLRCYQCGDTTADEPCATDTAEMQAEHYRWHKSVNDSDAKQKPYKYLKYCHNRHYNACVIERIEEIGRMFAFIRDCSDGLTFSIHDVPRFGTLKASLNHTTCAYMPLSKIMACVTLCDTDFCNGPQIDSGKEIPRAQKWIILSLVMTLCIIHIN